MILKRPDYFSGLFLISNFPFLENYCFSNRTKVTKTTDSTSTEFYGEFNLANQLVKLGNETISYDKNGNRTSDDQFEYKWNAADQLVAVTKKGESSPFATYKINGEITNYFMMVKE